MAFTIPEALKTTQNPMFAGIAKAVSNYDQTALVIPIQPVAGSAVSYMREGALPSFSNIPDAGTLTEESVGTDDVIQAQLRRKGGNMDMDDLAEHASGTTAEKIAKKAKAIWHQVKTELVTGGNTTGHTFSNVANPFTALSAFDYGPHLDSARRGPGSLKYTQATQTWEFRGPGDVAYGTGVVATTNGSYTLRSWNESYFIVVTITVATATTNGETLMTFTSSGDQFDGLNEMLDPGQIIAPVGANGDVFAFTQLDALYSAVRIEESRYYMANSKLIDKFYAAMRALNGTGPNEIALTGYNGMIPTYRGIPILRNDNVPSTETVGSTTNASSFYLVSLSAEDGLSLVARNDGQGLDINSDPRNRTVLGWRVKEVGELEGKDARRVRVTWTGAAVLRSKLAAARSRGIQTA